MVGVERFVQAQKCYYDRALEEVLNGHKESNWMLFIFPQVKGLGFSAESNTYSISDMAEAKEYLEDETLHQRLIEITQAVLDSDVSDISMIFDYPDNQKLRSCMTLFSKACPEEPVFKSVLDKYFDGECDERTLELLN